MVRGQVLSWAGITLAPRKKVTFQVKARVSACAPATGTLVARPLLQGSTCEGSVMKEVRRREEEGRSREGRMKKGNVSAINVFPSPPPSFY